MVHSWIRLLLIAVFAMGLIGCKEEFTLNAPGLEGAGAQSNDSIDDENNPEDEFPQNCVVNAKAQAAHKISQTSPLTKKKVFITPYQGNPSDSSVFAKLQVPIVEEGADLVALIDNNCKDRQSTYWAEEFSRSNNIKKNKLLVEAYSYKVKSNLSLSAFTNDLNEDPCVLAIERNASMKAFAVPNDSSFGDQDFHADLGTASAWDTFFDPTSGIDANQEIVIAVVDTGVDYDHEDLQASMWTNNQDEHGFDFVNNDNDPMDDQGHGSHVAGLVAATSDNNVGGSGIMGQQAKIMAVKVLDENGGGSLAGIVNGIIYAADNNADIINLSLGGPGPVAIVEEALLYAVERGSVVLAAAGNGDPGEEIASDNFIVPAAYAKDIDGVISVGATVSNTRTLAGFSFFSGEYVEIAAPGSGGILSTTPGNNYEEYEGTSMATPIVAGSVALMKALFQTKGFNFSPALLEQALIRGSVTETTLVDNIVDNRHLDLLELASFTSSHSDDFQITRQPRGRIVAINSDITLGAEVSEDFSLSYQWQKNGSNIPGATDRELIINNIQESDSGTYQLKISHGGGLRIQNSTMARIGVLPACN